MGRPGALEGVTFWPRVLARVIDVVVHIIISGCTGFLFGILYGIASALARHATPLKLEGGGLALFVAGLLGATGYEIVCETVHGSTLGKLALSMVVVQEDGTPCHFTSAVIRSFAYFVDALFFGIIGYLAMKESAQQQRHGDEWAHTVVCKRSEVKPENRRSAGHFVLALLLAAMVDSAFLLTGMLIKALG